MTFDFWAYLKTGGYEENRILKRSKLTLQVILDENKDDAKQKALATPDQPNTKLDCFDCQNLFLRNCTLPWKYSISMEFKWELTTPWFSRVESNFDVLDNPLSRDRLTGKPMFKASGLKGVLRHASAFFKNDFSNYADLINFCFGDANDSGNSGNQGKVKFDNVIFDKISSDIISPHDRKRGVADHPVGFEIVPQGATAQTSVFIFSKTENDHKQGIQAALLLLKSLEFLLTDLGISAKRSIGYGLGKLTQIKIKTGASIDLGKTGHQSELCRPFPEDEPEKPGTAPKAKNITKHPSDFFEDLVKDGELICPREKTFEILCEKKQWKGNKLKKWKGNDRAGEEWDKCKQYLEKQKSSEFQEYQKELKEYQKIKQKHDLWEQEKKAWESNPKYLTSLWIYDTFKTATENIEKHCIEEGNQ
ncbi:MAG: RAMP superfamily CRISPR-associated protein [Candidatus Hydrogenedentales bacterium]|jgi:CRISPR/Cas system CMR subunit Cmr6 (Cas7 group RAMP superfamily)